MSKHGGSTVADVIEYLKQLDQEAVVVLSSDSEGNSFSPLCLEHGEGFYRPDSTYSGDWIEDAEEIEDEEDKSNLYKAIVLFPVN